MLYEIPYTLSEKIQDQCRGKQLSGMEKQQKVMEIASCVGYENSRKIFRGHFAV